MVCTYRACLRGRFAPREWDVCDGDKPEMENQPEIVTMALGYAEQGWDIAKAWLLEPAAWSQFALLIVAFLAAAPSVPPVAPGPVRDHRPGGGQHRPCRPTPAGRPCRFLALLLPLIAYAFTAAGEAVVRSMFESGAVIAFGKRVFLFLAARALVRDIVTDPFLKLLGRYVLLPLMALYALGILDDLTAWLAATEVALGNIRFTALAIVRGVIAGSLLFWLGRWSTGQSKSLIEKQKELRPATRELAIKASELAIFGLLFIVLMNIMGIDLTTLAVLGGAIGVGRGPRASEDRVELHLGRDPASRRSGHRWRLCRTGRRRGGQDRQDDGAGHDPRDLRRALDRGAERGFHHDPGGELLGFRALPTGSRRRSRSAMTPISTRSRRSSRRRWRPIPAS